MNALITYLSQTGNTAKIARAIYEEASAQGHKVDLRDITDVTADDLDAYDVVFVGSTCHDTDLANLVKRLLEQIGESPHFKLAGFVTHATQMPEDGERERELYERWAGNCLRTFQRVSEEREITLLGYFHCQGAASAPIETFIHNTIVTDEDEWARYSVDMRSHPNEADLQKAKAFARQVLEDGVGSVL